MNIEITVRLCQDRETNEFVAHALPIDVSSFGATPDEAERMSSEAVQAFVESADAMGTLDDVMSDCGYVRLGQNRVKPQVSEEELSVAVGA